MKQIIFGTILILVFCFAVSAQSEESQIVPIMDPDVFGKTSWEEEKARLDIFAIELKNNTEEIGFITLKFDKNTTRNQKRIRLNQIRSYLVKTKRIEKNRFKLIVSNNLEKEETMYWIVDKSEIPK